MLYLPDLEKHFIIEVFFMEISSWKSKNGADQGQVEHGKDNTISFKRYKGDWKHISVASGLVPQPGTFLVKYGASLDLV